MFLDLFLNSKCFSKNTSIFSCQVLELFCDQQRSIVPAFNYLRSSLKCNANPQSLYCKSRIFHRKMQIISKAISHFTCIELYRFCKDVYFFMEIFYSYLKKKRFIKLIEYIIQVDLHINIGNQNFPTQFLDIMYYTIVIYQYSVFGFRLGSGQLNKIFHIAPSH